MTSKLSIQVKSNLHTDLHIYGPTILHSGLEAPLLDGFGCLGVEAGTQAADHTYVAWNSFIVDNQPKNAHSLRLRIPCLVGIFRIRRRNRLRGRDSATDFKYPPANATTAAGTDSRPVTDTNARPRTGANPATGANSIRRRRGGQRHSVRVTQIWHVILRQTQLRRNDHRRLTHKLWLFVANNNLRGSNLLHCELGQFSFGRRQPGVLAASASAAADFW